MKRINLYTTPLYSELFPSILTYHESWIDWIGTQKLTDQSQTRSNRNGWHSNTDILRNELFFPLKEILKNSCKRVCDDLSLLTENINFLMPCWANLHYYGGYNIDHIHPGSWISGVYYVSVPDGSGQLYFKDPRPQANTIGYPFINKLEVRAKNFGEKIYLPPEEGRLYLFPSWLEHGVTPNQSQEERVSISFNFFPQFSFSNKNE